MTTPFFDEFGVMIDIETLSTEKNPVVIQIGMVLFMLQTRQIIETFRVSIDFQDQINAGRHISKSTLGFWCDHPGVLRSILNDPLAMPTEKALAATVDKIAEWKQTFQIGEFWFNGMDFDTTHLIGLCEEYEEEVPWKFFEPRDLRTVKRFIVADPSEFPIDCNPTAAHDAVADCIAQVNQYYYCAEQARTRTFNPPVTISFHNMYSDGPLDDVLIGQPAEEVHGTTTFGSGVTDMVIIDDYVLVSQTMVDEDPNAGQGPI